MFKTVYEFIYDKVFHLLPQIDEANKKGNLEMPTLSRWFSWVYPLEKN
jgi:hypothetical protein